MSDDRPEIYQELHREQLAHQRELNHASATRILGIVFQRFRAESVLDVGCGLGTWLAAARQLGVRDVFGVDGSWLDLSTLDVEPSAVMRVDLEKGISLDRRFDLVVSLEVAEHLDAGAADGFVASLVRHGDVVLFSAAIPFQGGHHHVNEQFADYWVERFAAHGYHALDFVRPQIWSDEGVLWWLRQNVLVFAHERALERHARLRAELSVPRMLSVVLPSVYLSRVGPAQQAAEEHKNLIDLLSRGGTFKVTKLPDGQLTIEHTG